MNRLPPFPVSEHLGPSLRRCCSMGALLFLCLLIQQPAAQRQVSGVYPWTGVGPLYVRIHQRPQCLATTHMSGASCFTGCLATCFHTLFQEGKPSFDMFLLQSPRLLNSPLTAAESPKLAAARGFLGASHTPAASTSPPAAQMPLGGPGPHLDREWLLSWCMCGLYWARMVMVSHCCPMMSRACCSVALRRLMPLN